MNYWEWPEDQKSCDCCHSAVLTGAAVAFGLMGMAIGIKENHDPWYRCAVCGSHSLNSGGRCLSTTCYVDLPDRSDPHG